MQPDPVAAPRRRSQTYGSPRCCACFRMLSIVHAGRVTKLTCVTPGCVMHGR